MKLRSHFIKIIGSRGRAFLLAILLAIGSVIGGISSPNTAHAAIGSVTEYSVPYTSAYPSNLTLGPDNNIWYTGNNVTGKLTTGGSFTTYYRYTNYHSGITTGSDGNMWFAEYNSGTAVGSIVNETTSGTIVGQYNLPYAQQAVALALGPDGNVWFTVAGSGGVHEVGKITTSGVITEYTITLTGGSLAVISDITTGPDGNMWFTVQYPGSYHNVIGKITTSGTATTYTIPTYNAVPTYITTGPDGNMWFTETYADKVGKITTAGTITEYAVPTSSSPYGITAGTDGNMWFTERSSGKIGEISMSGTTAEYAIPGVTSANAIAQIITGPDGAVWFTINGLNSIGRLATQLTSQTASFTSSAPTGATVDSPDYVPTATATSGLPVTITADSSSTGVCSIDGSGNVSYQGAGTCVLDANQAGNVDYAPAPQVQQSFTVAPVNADSSVSLSCPATAHVGDTVMCMITVANAGPAAALNATLSALFPSSLTGASLSGGGTLSGQNITWSTPSLASGGSTVLTLSATASSVGKARVSAALLQTSPDPNDTNNLVNATIVVS